MSLSSLLCTFNGCFGNDSVTSSQTSCNSWYLIGSWKCGKWTSPQLQGQFSDSGDYVNHYHNTQQYHDCVCLSLVSSICCALGALSLSLTYTLCTIVSYLDTDRQLFFSLPYFHFCTSVFVLQHFPFAPCALQSAAYHIKKYASLVDLRVPVPANGGNVKQPMNFISVIVFT